MLSCAFSLTQRHQQGEWDLCEEGRRRTAFIVDLCWLSTRLLGYHSGQRQKPAEDPGKPTDILHRGYVDVFLHRCFTQPCMHARK